MDKIYQKAAKKSQKSWVTNYKFSMHLQEVELCDGFHLKSVVRNPKVQIRPHEKARQQRQTLIWWKPRPLAFHEVNCVNSGKTRQKEVVELFSGIVRKKETSGENVVLWLFDCSFLLTSFSLLFTQGSQINNSIWKLGNF